MVGLWVAHFGRRPPPVPPPLQRHRPVSSYEVYERGHTVQKLALSVNSTRNDWIATMGGGASLEWRAHQTHRMRAPL